MSRCLLTRDQVLESRQLAWVDDRSKQYFFDGVTLWRGQAMAIPVPPESAPSEGWHHQRDCQCAFCRRT